MIRIFLITILSKGKTMKVKRHIKVIITTLATGLTMNVMAASMQNMGSIEEITPMELNDRGLVDGKKSIFETHVSGGHWGQGDRGDPFWYEDYVTTKKDVLAYWNYENNTSALMKKDGKILINNNNIMIMEYNLKTNSTNSDTMPKKAFWLFYPNGETKKLANIPDNLHLCTMDDMGNITLKNEQEGSFFSRSIKEEENHPIPPLPDCKSPFIGNDRASVPSKEELESAVDSYYYKNTPMPKTYTFQGYEIPLGYYFSGDSYNGDVSKLTKKNYGWKLLKIMNVNQNQQLVAKMQYVQIDNNEGSYGWGTTAGTYYVFIDLNKN